MQPKWYPSELGVTVGSLGMRHRAAEVLRAYMKVGEANVRLDYLAFKEISIKSSGCA